MPLYIEKINGDVDQPTNRPTDQPGEYRAICLFRKLENRKKAEICEYNGPTLGSTSSFKQELADLPSVFSFTFLTLELVMKN